MPFAGSPSAETRDGFDLRADTQQSRGRVGSGSQGPLTCRVGAEPRIQAAATPGSSTQHPHLSFLSSLEANSELISSVCLALSLPFNEIPFPFSLSVLRFCLLFLSHAPGSGQPAAVLFFFFSVSSFAQSLEVWGRAVFGARALFPSFPRSTSPEQPPGVTPLFTACPSALLFPHHSRTSQLTHCVMVLRMLSKNL